MLEFGRDGKLRLVTDWLANTERHRPISQYPIRTPACLETNEDHSDETRS